MYPEVAQLVELESSKLKVMCSSRIIMSRIFEGWDDNLSTYQNNKNLSCSSNLTVAAQWKTTLTFCLRVIWSASLSAIKGSIRLPFIATNFEKRSGHLRRIRLKTCKNTLFIDNEADKNDGLLVLGWVVGWFGMWPKLGPVKVCRACCAVEGVTVTVTLYIQSVISLVCKNWDFPLSKISTQNVMCVIVVGLKKNVHKITLTR